MTERGGLDEVFARCRGEHRAALIAYLPAGYPDLPTSVEAVRTLVAAGADIVEVGVPYTDPLIDGPMVEQAAAAALEAGFRFPEVFDVVAAVRDAGAVPVVMSYYNPVLRYGPQQFAQDLAAAGGAGLITPDLIPEEAGPWLAGADEHQVAPVFLIAPSSTDERIALTTSACRGFVYAASTMGVTGTRDKVSGAAPKLVQRARAYTSLPICVGLGVSNGKQAAQVAGYADGVIVGSALVRAIGAGGDAAAGLAAVRALTGELAAGVRR